MLQRLIWKDATTVKPLVWAALIAVAVLNLFLFLLWQSREVTDSSLVESSIALWIFVPQLVAFGVPAMLVGTEEDQGTLSWMRTLPVSWRTVASAKLIVGACATALIWAVAAGVLYLFSFGWTDSPYGADYTLVTPRGVTMVLLNSAMLLMLGFTMAYFIRSPLVALFSLVLVYVFVSIAYFNFAEWMRWDRELPGFFIAFACGVGIVLMSWAFHWLFARQRLLLPENTIGPRHRNDLPVYTYRPPVMSVPERPSELASLLWQQVRQTGPLCIALLGLANLLVFAFCISQTNTPLEGPFRAFGFFSVPFVILSGSWLGAIAFYGDTINHRCGFFADRGISPTRVWWTRLAPPAIACGVLLMSISLFWFNFSPTEFRRIWGNPWQFIVLVTVMFTFGQLVSQWTDRPLLAFFAAPAYAVICLMPVFYVINRFDSSLTVIILTVPVLLFATWSQTRRWLDGRKKQYTARVLGYTAIAILIPCLLTLALAWLPSFAESRLVSTPSASPMQPVAQIDSISNSGFSP